MIYREIDKDGYYIQDIELDNNTDNKKYILENYGDMIKPKWDGSKWVDENPIDKLTELKKYKILDIKRIAGNIIISKYADWKQRNIIVCLLELKTKSVLTTDESLELKNYQSIWDWIKNIRQQSNNFENKINNLKTIEDVNNYEFKYIR